MVGRLRTRDHRHRGWTLGWLVVVALAAAACAPSEREQGGTTSPTVNRQGNVQLADEYSVQHARWAGQTVDSSKFKKNPPYRIATIVQGPTNGWGTIFDTVMNYELDRSGQVKDRLYVPWNGTTESQANGIDDAIAKHVDAIMLTALSRAGLVQPVRRAVKAGIPVITCMSTVASDDPTADVSRNIPMQGYESAKALAEMLGGKGKIVMLHGIPGVDAAEFWKSGAKAAFSQYPDIKILAEEYGKWSVSDALNAMRGVLTAQPQIDGVWIGGLEMGVSAINAFKEAGRPLPPIAGPNPTNGFLRLAIDNNVRFSASPFPPASSKVCVETLLKVLKGEPVKRFTEVGDVLQGAKPYGTDQARPNYRPEFNDDWIGPPVIPDEAYKKAKFGR